MILYEIRSTETNQVYVGITRNSLDKRWRAHKSAAKRGLKSKLYDAMRAKGINTFSIKAVAYFDTEDALLEGEKDLIKLYRELSVSLNILDGGESHFPIHDMEAWKQKLKEKRTGRKPALGMKHSEGNKKLFSEAGKRRWDMYGRYPDDIVKLRFVDANKQFGISKTHFYRLRKQAGNTDAS